MDIVILAGGSGSRMRSDIPKSLMRLGNATMLAHVIRTANALQQPQPIVVVNPKYPQSAEEAQRLGAVVVEQSEPLGTGHAVAQALPACRSESIMVLYADMPLINIATLERLQKHGDTKGPSSLALLTAHLEQPEQYGRVVRTVDGSTQAIVEYADANAEQRAIGEIFTGVLLASRTWLEEVLPSIGNANKQGEYYLTDLVGIAVAQGVAVGSESVARSQEAYGANTQAQLARMERVWQKNQAEQLLDRGLAVADPARFDQRGELEFGDGCSIDIDVIVEGRVVLGKNVRIGAHVILRDVELGDGVEVLPYSMLEGVTAESDCRIGPFARLRPQTHLAHGARVGNFVETKNTRLGANTKANHLSYLGDLTTGVRNNLGAGMIHCNYDGKDKHSSELGDDVFIGSNVALVGPVKIGEHAYVAAGSTLNRDVQERELGIARSRQRNISGWKKSK